MQTLRKKNSPCKYKYELNQFLGEGITFKAKLIGILEVSEARGDQMCQAALADLKMAIRAAGEHKQRITIHIKIDGLRLRDEKSGDCLYHHPVHKISFITQDMSDSRAFGYIFGSPDTGHKFFGIKTDKAASPVVMAMRDLFYVCFELKEKEIKLTKQHLEQNAINVIKVHSTPDTKGAAGSESNFRTRNTSSEADKPADKRNESQSGVIADLLDLQFELNFLQQGIHHMNKITPGNQPPSTDDLFETDPFGDSFANMKLDETVRPILPPPPSSSKRGHLERQQTVPGPHSSITSSPATTITSKTPPLQGSVQWFDKEADTLFNEELTSSAKNTPVKKEMDENQAKSPQIDVFTELDPLGTGLIKPYVDKKDFFQHLKNPPKKVLKDLVGTSSVDSLPANYDFADSTKLRNDALIKDNQFDDNSFANADRFGDEAIQTAFACVDASRRTEMSPRPQPLSVSLPPEDSPKASGVPMSGSLLTRMDKDSTESVHGLVKLPSPIKSSRKKEFDVESSSNKAPSMDKPFPVDFSAANESPASPMKSYNSDANSRLSTSSAELELVPEPPPKGLSNIMINPPPLPPKKQGVRAAMKPPPRPPHTDYFHYDFPERETTTKNRSNSPSSEPKGRFDDNFSPPVPVTKSDLIGTMTTSAFEDSFSTMMPTTNLSTFFTDTKTTSSAKKTKPSLDITLSQLTSSNLDELANSLGMTVKELSSLTLQQLTECLTTLLARETAFNDTEEQTMARQEHAPESKSLSSVQTNAQSAFDQSFNIEQESKEEAAYDKYAVFRELRELEQLERNEDNETKETEDETSSEPKDQAEELAQQESCDESRTESLASLANLTVKLPPSNEDLTKDEPVSAKAGDISEPSLAFEQRQSEDNEINVTESMTEIEASNDFPAKQTPIEAEEDSDRINSIDIEKNDDKESIDKRSSSNEDSDKPAAETSAEETNGSIVEKTEAKSSLSTSSDRYAALREIIGEPELVKQSDKETQALNSSPRASPVIQSSQSKSSAEVELLNLFSDTPPTSSPKKQASIDIFEEIKMLSTTGRSKESSQRGSGMLILEDIFCSFEESKERDDNKDDKEDNWAKFDTGLFASERPCEGSHSVGGTLPWSPDGKEYHKDPSFKGNVYRQSGDSDNEWKDEEESEESNGRIRGDDRFWCSRLPRVERSRMDAPRITGPGNKRDRIFRDRMAEKSREATWTKNPCHRRQDPSLWHEEGQWDKEARRYLHRKMPYKDEEEYESYWKFRAKLQRWLQLHEHGPFYEEERKRKMMMWKEDRFGSQESMGYEEEDRWPRRKYERRRWEEDARFYNRRGGPPDADYPSRDGYYYYRENRDRTHDYPSTWDEDYGSDRPGDDSPRYNPSARKRHWPKRPNSAIEGRNAEVSYPESRGKFGASRSECSDNDSDPYPRSSQRSRSREGYWGSDQEYDGWVPYWSEGPDTKTESLHRKKVPRHKPRQPHAKSQSPFEDDFAQSLEHVDPSTVEPSVEPRIRSDMSEQQQLSPTSSKRYAKEPARKEREYSKRSSYFEDDLSTTASGISDQPTRQRLPSDLKATPEEPTYESKEVHSTAVGFATEDTSRDSFFNGDLRYDDDDALAFKSELDDNMSDHRSTTLPLKNHSRQGKYGGNNNNNSKSRSEQYIRKSESVNIFVRENDPFDDDDFFN